MLTDSSAQLTTDHPLIRSLTAEAPTGWERIDAAFALTVAARLATVVCSDGRNAVTLHPPESVLDQAAAHRARSASPEGPWWRMLLTVTAQGEVEVEYDHGAEPFPESQLLPPDAYRADLEAFPRARVPVWLAAYLAHDDRQLRGARQAAEQARADRAKQVWPELAENEFPPFPIVWARWATLSAAFVALGSEWGPRILPWTGVFEGAGRSGSTLHALPHGRAVLSGGVWNAPELDAVYNGGAPMPDLYAGAPEWVTDDVLNPRAGAGLLSFCYWWEAGRWYRGGSPAARECATALPGMWTADIVCDLLSGLIGDSGGTGDPERIAALVEAAETATVTRELLGAVFAGDHDLDGALHQFDRAGLAATRPGPIPAARAIAQVRDYIRGHGLDTTGYPLSELTAERFGVGWMVYVPVADGEMAIGRAVFYIADDGALEHSSSSVPPATAIAGQERAFTARHGFAATGPHDPPGH